MLDKATAQQLVLDYVNKTYDVSEDSLTIVEEATLEKPYGWIFFYDSQRFLETLDFKSAVAGNAPVLVDKTEQTLVKLGTAYPVDVYIAEYEAEKLHV